MSPANAKIGIATDRTPRSAVLVLEGTCSFPNWFWLFAYVCISFDCLHTSVSVNGRQNQSCWWVLKSAYVCLSEWMPFGINSVDGCWSQHRPCRSELNLFAEIRIQHTCVFCMDVAMGQSGYLRIVLHSEHRFPAPFSRLCQVKLRYWLRSLPPRNCPPTESAPSERSGY